MKFFFITYALFSWPVALLAQDKKIESGISAYHTYKVAKLDDGSVSIINRRGIKLAELMSSGDERTAVEFVCLWSPDESEVAYILHWGTKRTAFAVWAKQKSGRFSKLHWKEPDPAFYYKSASSYNLSQDYDLEFYAMDKWKDSSGLRVVLGKCTPDLCFVLDCELQIESNSIVTKSVKRVGILDDRKKDTLIKLLVY